ncbi:MAG: hypothetical protein A2173_02570 [Planctomycetes bacterium RBG_13_44_8b]|nr:MAG: hypothetical protein A2173_02570 [Planctomycetes bacterium RBG_13_44_8b]
MSDKKFNLFIYGSLLDPWIFKSVSGFGFKLKPAQEDKENLLAEPAFLPGYRKVTPDNVYFYAVASATSRIEGIVILDVPASAMAEIDRYEGKRYDRETVHVNTANGDVEAQAYLASHESMKKHFGDRFHVNLIHELWLRKRIEKFIEKRTRPGDQTADAEIERRAERELLATTERDLVISHYRKGPVSDFYLEHELDRPRPSIKHLYDDPQAQPFIEKYLALVVKQVLLNQLDEKIQSNFRFEIEHMLTSERYFRRSKSLLAALQMINANASAVNLIIDECLKTMPYVKHDLIDYVKYAVRAADSMFDTRVAKSVLDWIRSNLQPGLVPLGAELELSNLGFAAIEPQRITQKALDPLYDDFKYFSDFNLDVLSWKLGGYIDDHTGDTTRTRRLGFLELAPGRLNLAGELSRPATADPWLLSKLINEIVTFYKVRPHSLHISFQLREKQIGRQQILPLNFVKCLLALGGGLCQRDNGKLWISRMGNGEIIQYRNGEELVFARTSKRGWYLGEDEIADKPPIQATSYIQQYKFIRLEKMANYEPLILCLKGLQMSFNPADYITSEQLKADGRLRRDYEELKKWADQPTEISDETINRFIDDVRLGLMNESHYRPAHKLHYIDWALSAVAIHLRMFNKRVGQSQNQPETDTPPAS